MLGFAIGIFGDENNMCVTPYFGIDPLDVHLMPHIAVSMGGGTHIDQVPQDQLDDFFEVRQASDPYSIK